MTTRYCVYRTLLPVYRTPFSENHHQGGIFLESQTSTGFITRGTLYTTHPRSCLILSMTSSSFDPGEAVSDQQNEYIHHNISSSAPGAREYRTSILDTSSIEVKYVQNTCEYVAHHSGENKYRFRQLLRLKDPSHP